MKIPRMADWMLVALLLTALIAWLAPQQLPVTAYKLSLASLAAIVGYWLDRSAFPGYRPDAVSNYDRPMSMLRRALIMAAVIIGVCLGA